MTYRLGGFFLVFSYSSLLCFGLFTFLTSQSSSTRTPGLGLGLHGGLGDSSHGGSVGHTGGLDRTGSISVEGGTSTGTTAWVKRRWWGNWAPCSNVWGAPVTTACWTLQAVRSLQACSSTSAKLGPVSTGIWVTSATSRTVNPRTVMPTVVKESRQMQAMGAMAEPGATGLTGWGNTAPAV